MRWNRISIVLLPCTSSSIITSADFLLQGMSTLQQTYTFRPSYDRSRGLGSYEHIYIYIYIHVKLYAYTCERSGYTLIYVYVYVYVYTKSSRKGCCWPSRISLGSTLPSEQKMRGPHYLLCVCVYIYIMLTHSSLLKTHPPIPKILQN